MALSGAGRSPDGKDFQYFRFPFSLFAERYRSATFFYVYNLFANYPACPLPTRSSPECVLHSAIRNKANGVTNYHRTLINPSHKYSYNARPSAAHQGAYGPLRLHKQQQNLLRQTSSYTAQYGTKNVIIHQQVHYGSRKSAVFIVMNYSETSILRESGCNAISDWLAHVYGMPAELKYANPLRL